MYLHPTCDLFKARIVDTINFPNQKESITTGFVIFLYDLIRIGFDVR